MPMSREEHKKILADILETKDPAKISEHITKLSENYNSTLTENKLTDEERKSLKTQNDDLVKQNMELFLKIGQADEKKDDPPPPEENERKPIKYTDLASDNGHIF